MEGAGLKAAESCGILLCRQLASPPTALLNLRGGQHSRRLLAGQVEQFATQFERGDGGAHLLDL